MTIPGYNEDDSPAFLDAVSDVSTNGSAGDPVPLVDDQAEPMLLLQVEPPTSWLLVPHEHIRNPPSVLVTEKPLLNVHKSFEKIGFFCIIHRVVILVETEFENTLDFTSKHHDKDPNKIYSADDHSQFISVGCY